MPEVRNTRIEMASRAIVTLVKESFRAIDGVAQNIKIVISKETTTKGSPNLK